MNKFVIAAIAASLSYPAFAQSGTTMPPDQQKPSPSMQDDKSSPTRSQSEMGTTPSDTRSPSETRRRGASDNMGTSSERPSSSETRRGAMHGGTAHQDSQRGGATTVRQVQQALNDKGY